MALLSYKRRWPTEDSAASHFETVRWGERPNCPYCGSDRVCTHASKDKRLPRRQCQDCHRAFSATVGTIFHGSHVPFRAWLLAIAALLTTEGKLSIAHLGRELDLPYKTVWSMVARLRKALANDEAAHAFFQRLIAPASRRDRDSKSETQEKRGAALTFGVLDDVPIAGRERRTS